MSVVRMNITIPKELADEIEKMTPSRKRSSFIAEALRQKVKDLQRERIEQELEEGYKMNRDESLSIAREFECLDMEGWDEY
ncbi:MAG: hypothetical protein FJ106_13110 [Deltaproteobacteria bacterium]|nr:hypothetical protein [Deltaproteobacteria bacterium]